LTHLTCRIASCTKGLLLFLSPRIAQLITNPPPPPTTGNPTLLLLLKEEEEDEDKDAEEEEKSSLVVGLLSFFPSLSSGERAAAETSSGLKRLVSMENSPPF
jgi:hypothetical protein